MKKYKILFTICTKQFAGTERQLLTLSKYLKERFDIIVVCPKDSALNSKLNELDIKVLNIDFRLKDLFKLVNIIRREQIDIIHNHLGKSSFIGTLAARLAGVKHIVTTRHFIKPAYTNRKSLMRFISLLGHRFINRLNTKLIAVSEGVREAVIKREKVPPDKITTIYNGTDLQPKTPCFTSEVGQIGYKIGVISRLSKEKGIDYLIEAMPDVLKEFPDAECLIGGIGPQENELKQKVETLHLESKVKFLGYVDNIEEFLSEIDVFVLPAIEEPFGLAIIEAQNRGKPVIATNAGGPKEIIKHNETGLLILPKNSKALTDAVVRLFKDKKLAKKLATAGQKRARELFTAEKMAKKTEKLYQTLINPSLAEKKKKVLIIGHHFVTKNNQRRIEELVKFGDLDITLLTPKWWNEESRKVYLEKDYDKDYAIYSGQTLFTGHNAFSFYITSLYRLLFRIKPDIIDIYEEPWSLTTFQTILFKRLFLRKSKVMFYSAQNINKKYPFPFNLIERFTFNNADYCYPCSKGVAEVLKDKGYKGKIKVVPLGLDIGEMEKEKSDVFTIGFVGRLVEEKGVFDLLDAAGRLDFDYRLLFVGDGPLRNQLIIRAKGKGIADKVDVVGAVPRDRILDYYKKMDVLVAPSKTTKRWKEQFGRMIVEAFAYGVPVIGSDSGSIPEVMAGCGLVFKEGNIVDLKEKIIEIYKDEGLRKDLIEKGKEYTKNNYTWSKVVNMVHDIYKDIPKKRVLFLDHMSKPSGGEIYLLEVLRNVNKNKYDIKVLLGKDGFLYERLKDEGIDVEVMNLPESIIELRKEKFGISKFKEIIGVILYAYRIKNYIKKNKIDIVYTNSIKSDIYGSIASWMSKRPCIWHLHDRISADYFPHNLCKLLIFLSRHFTNKIICNSLATKDAFLEAGGDEEKAEVILNGIDTDRFNIERRVDGEVKKIAMIGRISPWKGQKVFIQAAKEIIKQRKDINFYIAGSVLFGEEDYKKEIEKLVSQNGLSDKLEFLGFIEDIPLFLSDIDILVHASVIPEPFGLSVAEAMAAGLPVVASRAGGILEMIKDGENGLLYEPGNYKELAKSILRVLDDKDLALRLSHNAKETVKNRFNIKDSVKRIEEVLETV